MKIPLNSQEALKDKKDIESWIDQADPSLTVHELPKDPKISFRKNVLNKNNKNSEKDVRIYIILKLNCLTFKCMEYYIILNNG